MTGHTGYNQRGHSGQTAHAQNASYDRLRDAEMLDLTGAVSHDQTPRKPFDWCILSVFGYLCCWPIGLCAMYYAMRANHGHDHSIEDYKVNNSTAKAKLLTIISIVLGSLACLALIIIVIIVVYEAASGESNMSYMRNGVQYGRSN